MEETVIKRPVFVSLLAFALGEIIAVCNTGSKALIILLSILLYRKSEGISYTIKNNQNKHVITIITKKQALFFVVIFLSLLIGWLVTTDAIRQRDEVYLMSEKRVIACGKVSRIEKTDYCQKIYLEKVKLEDEFYNQLIIEVPEESDIKIGNTIKVSGVLKQFEKARNPGNFDAKKYYMSLGIYGKMVAENIVILESKRDLLREFLHGFKSLLLEKIKTICLKDSKGIWKICAGKDSVFSAILLGEKSELNQEIKELYSVSGIAHILAISGLHISFIGMIFYRLMRKRFRFAFSASVSMTAVIVFGIMSGMGIAAVRAIVMFGLRMLGEVLGRTYDNLTAISMAGILLLLWNPFAILNSGFQMSFAAIIAITFVWSRVQEILKIGIMREQKQPIEKNNITCKQKMLLCFEKGKNKIFDALIFSMTIGVIMNPIVAYSYYQLPLYSFLLNIVVVPLMSFVIISGIVAIGISFFSVFIGRIAVLLGCAILEFYTIICRFAGKIPGANIIVGKPSLIAIITYYIFFICVLWILWRVRNKIEKENKKSENVISKNGKVIESKRDKLKRIQKSNRKITVRVFFALILLNLWIYVPKLSNEIINFMESALSVEESGLNTDRILEVTFLDVGQGDGIFLKTYNGINIMIDGGSLSVDDAAKYRIVPFLKYKGISRIDYVFVTHADYDHISGILEMLKNSNVNGIKIKNLILPDIRLKDENYQSLIETALRNNIKVLYIMSENILQFGDVKFKCIYPNITDSAEDRNDYSTVLSVKYNKFSMLLTGDISEKVENKIKDKVESHYTILKVAHHGSKYSTTEKFLSWINPDYSVISVGENNLYGHPHKELLKRLEKSGSSVLRTDKSGGITIKSEGESMVIEKSIE